MRYTLPPSDIQAAIEDGWLELIAAIFNRARRDTAGTHPLIKWDAEQFLTWAEREAEASNIVAHPRIESL